MQENFDELLKLFQLPLANPVKLAQPLQNQSRNRQFRLFR
jgi:hypothetical protein